jgi:hypothetical protein
MRPLWPMRREPPRDARSGRPSHDPTGDGCRASDPVALARSPVDVVADIENKRDPENGPYDAAELAHICQRTPTRRSLQARGTPYSYDPSSRAAYPAAEGSVERRGRHGREGG